MMIKHVFLLAGLLSINSIASAQQTLVPVSALSSEPVPSPFQSPATPLNLPISGPVYQYSSDFRSADFYTQLLPEFMRVMNDNLREQVQFSGTPGFKIDPTKLYLRRESNEPIRVYFLYEAASYHNSLGYTWTKVGSKTKGPRTILFPDASLNKSGPPNPQAPLSIGDFVEIDDGENGWQLDFFLVADGARGGTTTLWADEKLNADRLQHMVAFMLPDSRYILIGFEDATGAVRDSDFNDALFVVDVGEENAKNLFLSGTLPY